jgi:hypothetical protein
MSASSSRKLGRYPRSGIAERRKGMLRGLILWLLGVPLVVIILLYLFVF